MGSEHSDVLENGHMFSMNPLDPSEFRRQAHMVVDFIADYYCNVEKYPVRSQVDPGYLGMLLPSSAPDEPEPIEDILDDIQAHIVPGLTHWQSPNHFAYFPSSGSTAGFLGEMLSVGFNVVGFNWMASPAATELECIVMDWLGKLIELPTEFLFAGGGGGVLQGTTCEAMLCTIVAARDKALQKIGKDGINRLVVYGSDQTHFALQKAARIAGIHPDNFRAIKTYRSDQFRLSPESLRQVVSNDIDIGLVPLYLCATVGTTPSTAVDPLTGLCMVAHEHCMWVHVDAACAGSACICPEFRHHIDGVEGASSFSFNAHKWFLTTLDCCCLWVKEPAALIGALSTDPELLKSSSGTESNRMVNYKDWQIQLSRRFRALKLWMVLRSYGTTQLRNFLRGHVNMARLFEGLVGADPRFEVVVPTNFAMVCFRFVESESELVRTNEVNRRILEAVNSTGRAYMTHAMVGGVYAMRFAVGATLTEERHVRGAWDVVRECADAQLPLTFCHREESKTS